MALPVAADVHLVAYADVEFTSGPGTEHHLVVAVDRPSFQDRRPGPVVHRLERVRVHVARTDDRDTGVQDPQCADPTVILERVDELVGSIALEARRRPHPRETRSGSAGRRLR